MKRFSALILAVCVLFAGCKKSDTATVQNGSATSVTSSPQNETVLVTSPSAEQEKAELDKVAELYKTSLADPLATNIGAVKLNKGDQYAEITVKDYGTITVKLLPHAAPEGVKNFVETANSGFYSGKKIHRVIPGFMFQGGSRNGNGMSSPQDPSFAVEANPAARHFYGALCYANAEGINGTQFYVVNSKNDDYPAMKSNAENFKIERNYYNTAVDAYKTSFDKNPANTETEYYYKDALVRYQDNKNKAEWFELNPKEVEEQYAKSGGTSQLDGGYTVFGQTVDGFDIIDKISDVETMSNMGFGETSNPVTPIIIESVVIKTKE